MAFVWARWAPHYAGTDGQESGRQIPRARCAWMCFHVSRKCLTPGPLLTSNLGCQRHFLECPVKINMWTETGGLETPVWWARGPSWHLCPATPLATYANIKLYKIKCLFPDRKLVCGYCKSVDLVVRKVFLNIHHHQQVCFHSILMIWASLSLCAEKLPLGIFFKVVRPSLPSKGRGSHLDLGATLPFNHSDPSLSTLTVTGTLCSIMCKKVFWVIIVIPP